MVHRVLWVWILAASCAPSPSPPDLTPSEWASGEYGRFQGKEVWLGGFLHGAGPVLLETLRGGAMLGLEGVYLLWLLDGRDTVWVVVKQGPLPEDLVGGVGVWVRGKGDDELLIVEKGTDVRVVPGARAVAGRAYKPTEIRRILGCPEKKCPWGSHDAGRERGGDR